MEIAKIHVTGTYARIVSRKPIPEGLIGGYITVEYRDPVWQDLTKTVVFKGAVTRDVVTEDRTVTIPAETIAAGKRMLVGFYGTRAEGILAIPTFWADLGTVMAATDPSGDESTDPSLPVWAQLTQRVEKLEKYGTGGSSGGTGGTAEGAVLYTAQKLTEEQKAQARENIQAASDEELGSILEDVPMKNILPPDYQMGYWDASSNALIKTTSHCTTAKPIPVEGGETLYVTWAESTNAITNKLYCAVYFDANGAKVKSQSGYFGPDKDSNTKKYIDIPANCTHMHFWVSKFGEGLRLADICLSYSSTNAYVPYEPPGRKVVKTSALNESARNILSPLYGKTVVNFGDSIYGKRRPPDDISTELAKLTGAVVYNCGFGGCQMQTHWNSDYAPFSMCNLADAIVSGDWTAQDAVLANISSNGVPAYFSEPVGILKNLDFSTVDIITIAYGTNDFATDKALDSDSEPTATNTFAGALRYSIEKLLTAYPNLKMYICSPVYRFWVDDEIFVDDSDTHTNAIGAKLTDFVDKTKAVVEEYHLPYIDCYYTLGFNKFNRLQYFYADDGTHPNTAGCHVIAAHMAKALC